MAEQAARDALFAFADYLDRLAENVDEAGDIGAGLELAANMARQRARGEAEPLPDVEPPVSEGGEAEAGTDALSAAMAAELDWFRNRRTERGGSWGMPPRAQVERLIAGAEPVIRAADQAKIAELQKRLEHYWSQLDEEAAQRIGGYVEIREMVARTARQAERERIAALLERKSAEMGVSDPGMPSAAIAAAAFLDAASLIREQSDG